MRSSITTFKPFSAADNAQHRPEKPAPTITTSASTVSLISLSAIGSGAVSNSYVPAVPFALALEAPAVPSFGCAAHPASVPTPATAAVATALAAKAPFKKLRRSMLGMLSCVMSIPSSLDDRRPAQYRCRLPVPSAPGDDRTVSCAGQRFRRPPQGKKPHRGFSPRGVRCDAVSWF